MSGFKSSLLFARNALSPNVNCWNSGGRKQRELRLRRSLAQIVCLLFALLAMGTETYAKDVSETLKPFLAKCDTLEPDNTNYVIWDADTDILHACSKFSNNEQKVKSEEKIKKILKSLEASPEAKADFLSFRLNARIEDHNAPILRSAYKVKKGKSLYPLISATYDTLDNEEVIAPPIDSETNRFTEDGYVFLSSPDNKAKRKCILFVFKDGYKSDPIEQDKIKKSCIFRSLPTHFYLVPAREIKYPSFSIQSAITAEGSSLEFDLVKEGELSLELPSTLNYEVLSRSASKDDFNSISNTNVITFEHAETSKQILVETVDDQFYEGDEKLSVRIYNPSHQSDIKDGTADGIIEDNDPKAIVSISGGQAREGEFLRFKVEREVGISKEPISINYSFIGGTAGSNDYNKTPGIIEFAASDLEKFIVVETFIDSSNEEPEQIKLLLTSSDDVKFSNPEAIGTLYNFEPITLSQSGIFSIKGDTVEGGNPLEFTITRTPPYKKLVTINYKTRDVEAKSGEDYVRKIDRLEFKEGDRQKTVRILTKANNSLIDKTLLLTISSDNNVQFSNDTALGVIKKREQDCKTDLDELRKNTIDNTIVDFIKKFDGYKRIFETTGKVQPCDYVYASVNGTVVTDIKTNKPIYVQASKTGEYRLVFAASSIDGTNERRLASDEASSWNAANPEMELQVGSHYGMDSETNIETFAVYASSISPNAVQRNDFNQSVGKFQFATIPGTDGCYFEYRYDPEKIKTPPLFDYKLSGERRNGICHIRAQGVSRIPSVEHVLFATKDSDFSDAKFTPSSDGKFDVSIPFPDMQNFYTVNVYLSGGDYSGATRFHSEVESRSSLGQQIPIDSQGRDLPHGQPPNPKNEITANKIKTMSEFFAPLLGEMKQRYENCDDEPEAHQIYCRINLTTTGKSLEANHTFELSGIRDALKDPENANALANVANNIDVWAYALQINSKGREKENADPVGLRGNNELKTEVPISIIKSNFKSSEEFEAQVVMENTRENSPLQPDGEKPPTEITVEFTKDFDWRYYIEIFLMFGGFVSMLYAFYKWLTELRFMKFSNVVKKNRSKVFSAIIDAYSSTSELIADSKNKWAYSAQSVDYNELWSLKKQAGKILDYVYSKDKEDDIIKKLKSSKPANEKVKKLP